MLIALCDEFTYNNPEKALQFFEQAREHYFRALEVNRQAGDYEIDAFYESVCHLGSGKSLFHLGKMDEALSGLQQAGETMKHFGFYSYRREYFGLTRGEQMVPL